MSGTSGICVTVELLIWKVYVETSTTSWVTTLEWQVGWWKALLLHLQMHGKPEPAAQTLYHILETLVTTTSSQVQIKLLYYYVLSYKSYYVIWKIPYFLAVFQDFIEQQMIYNKFNSECFCVLEKYADFWCSKLTDPEGVFAPCHAVVSPSTYKDVGLYMQSFNENFAAELLLIVSWILFWQNCMYDTCNCEKSEDCMCAAVSSYVYACSAAGVHISGWRKTICGK